MHQTEPIPYNPHMIQVPTYTTIYSSDSDLAHVYESSDEAYSSDEFSFEIVDASTISDAYQDT